MRFSSFHCRLCVFVEGAGCKKQLASGRRASTWRLPLSLFHRQRPLLLNPAVFFFFLSAPACLPWLWRCTISTFTSWLLLFSLFGVAGKAGVCPSSGCVRKRCNFRSCCSIADEIKSSSSLKSTAWAPGRRRLAEGFDQAAICQARPGDVRPIAATSEKILLELHGGGQLQP